jgi:hypothetical protein
LLVVGVAAITTEVVAVVVDIERQQVILLELLLVMF